MVENSLQHSKSRGSRVFINSITSIEVKGPYCLKRIYPISGTNVPRQIILGYVDANLVVHRMAFEKSQIYEPLHKTSSYAEASAFMLRYFKNELTTAHRNEEVY